MDKNQAYREKPAVEVSRLPRQEEKSNPVVKDKHNIKNLAKLLIVKLILWKETEGKPCNIP